MELTIIGKDGKAAGKHKLPSQFQEEVRSDLIKRAVQVIESHDRQPYGSDPMAGLKQSTWVSRRRRKYRGSYGQGISRVPRKIMSRRGTRINWVGAEAPGTVGGRRAHPPKASKVWDKKINTQERKKAIRSAIAATIDPSIVKGRGHKIPDTYPFILDDFIETEKKTREVIKLLETIGFADDLGRASERRIRAGKGTMRNRRYKESKSVLLVVADTCDLSKSAANVPGVEVVPVKKLNAMLLAPGSDIGRATLFTKKALMTMEKEDLFN